MRDALLRRRRPGGGSDQFRMDASRRRRPRIAAGSDAEKALFGDGKATSIMKTTYVNVVALYIPKANTGKQVTAVGSERQPIKVEASE